MNKQQIVFNSLGVTYMLNNVIHRSNGPAIMYADGHEKWRLYGKWHRYYGPADFIGEDWWVHDRWIRDKWR